MISSVSVDAPARSMVLALLLLSVLFTSATCADDPAEEGSVASAAGGDRPDQLRVVTTVSPITSIAESIGGSRAFVVGVVPEGTNSHTFEPAPSDAQLLAEADLIVVNGLSLEEPTLQMAEANKREDAVVLLLGDSTIDEDEYVFDFSFPQSEGRPNPHLWTSPLLALRYAELIEEQLARLDPENQDYFQRNLEAFRGRIAVLDAAISEAVETIPPAQRKLLTYHDSWPYFAQRYGMEVIGAAQPSDFSEPSPRELASLIDQIEESRLLAIFGSEVFPSETLEAIARQTGATYVDELRDDDLPGKPGEERHSYFGLMVTNMEIMIPALGGDASALDGFDMSPVFEGDSAAVYPQ